MLRTCMNFKKMAKNKIIIAAAAIVLIISAVITIIYVFPSKKDKAAGDEPKKAAKTTILVGPIDLPKAPHYDESRNSIYVADLFNSAIIKYVPGEKNFTYGKVGKEPIAFVVPVKGKPDKFIISYGPDVGIVTWDGQLDTAQYSKLGPISATDIVYRANNGKVAPSGNLFIATHSPPSASDDGPQSKQAALYSYRKDKTSKKILGNVTVGNAMAWSADSKKFYFIDSLEYIVTAYDYDKSDDSLKNADVILDYKKEKLAGVPDGMAIDKEGKLWITSWDGTLVLRICPNSKKIMLKLELNALRISSAVYARNKLLIMTAKYGLSESDLEKYTQSGYILEERTTMLSGPAGMPFEIDI